MAERVEVLNKLIGKWIPAEEADEFDEIIMGQMLKAEHFPNGNPLRVLRRLAYMFDMLKNPHDRLPQKDRRADWLLLPSGVVMKYRGRQHTRYFLDADETDTNNYLFTEVARLARKGSELRFVVDSSFKPGSAPVSFQKAVLQNLRNGNPNWISKKPNLITRLSLLRDDFHPCHTLDERRFYIRKLTTDDAPEALDLYRKFYPGNSFRPESIERYDNHYGAFSKEDLDKELMVAALGVVSEFNINLANNPYHVVIPGDAVTHREYRDQMLSPNLLTMVIESIFNRNPSAVLVADVSELALNMCKRIGFKGGQEKDKFYWYAFEHKRKTVAG